MADEIIRINCGSFGKLLYICTLNLLDDKTKMKRYTLMAKLAWMLCLMAVVSGCHMFGSAEYSPYQHIFVEEEAHLTDDASSPYCDFTLDYSCLNEKDDSIAGVINRSIQWEFLGEEFAALSPEAAVDSFKNVYLRDYRKEVGELYWADLDKSTSRESVPQWYAQTYSMVTFVEEGRGGTVNASANYYVDMGGAHPNQWSRWINYDCNTGKQLAKEDVFRSDALEEVEQILFSKLLADRAELHSDAEVKTLEDLQALGYLQMTNIYIPDNFLLGKNAVMFLFNRYDIAPYSAGEIVLEVPYEEIGHCLNNK